MNDENVKNENVKDKIDFMHLGDSPGERIANWKHPIPAVACGDWVIVARRAAPTAIANTAFAARRALEKVF